MPYKNKDKQKAFQKRWIQKRREEFLDGKHCSLCTKPAEGALSAKNKGKTFSWSYSKRLLEEKLKGCALYCEKHLLSEKAKHLGRKSTRHGHSQRSKTYVTWESMKQRCNNESHDHYKYYGGRGIRVCKRWNSFENFLADMGERPPKLTLDRIDPNKGYEPLNCRWADSETQANNKRNSKGKTYFKIAA